MELVAYLLGYVEIIVFAWGIVQMRFCRSKVRLVMGVIGIVLANICRAYSARVNIVIAIIVLVIPKLSVALLFEGQFFKNVFKSFFCSSYIGFVYLPVRLLIAVFDAIIGFDFIEDVNDMICKCLALVLMFGLAYYLKKKGTLVKWISQLPIGYFIVAWLCGTAIDGINSYSNSIMTGVSGNVRVLFEFLRTILSVAIYTLGIGFSFADFLRKKYRDESILKDEYLRMSKAHYSGLVTHMKEIRSIRHDMRAHIHMIRTYIKNKDFSAMEAYVDELASEHSLQTVKYYNTGNELVDAILTDGMRRCKNDEVRLECKGSLEGNVKISDYDLCIIMSNLLSNAIEACERLVHSEKFIKVLLESNERTVRIVFENLIEWEVDIDKLGTYTSKSDKNNHGLGINNVKRTVEKYDGTMVMSCEEGKFRTIIVINI